MTVFEDREDAGRRLAEALAALPLVADGRRVVVLAVPRGGLPVGAEVARALGAPLDVVIVRRVRAPHNPEIVLGSVGWDGAAELDGDLTAALDLDEAALEQEVSARREAVARRLAHYRGVAAAVDVRGAVAVVVDDGISTGGTARAACAVARRLGAAAVVLAVPVGPAGVEEDLAEAADAVVVLSTPAEMLAIAQAYRDFPALDDEGSLRTLRAARARA